MTRLHPFDHVFAPLVSVFGEIEAEMETVQRSPPDRTQFASLSSVRRLAAGLEDPATVEADPAAVDQYLTVLWVGYRFWIAGSLTLDTERDTLAEKLDHPAPTGVGASMRIAYARFPERWLWAQVSPEAPHEPIDGLFVVPGVGGKDLTVVAVLGLRPDRPGFGQITEHATAEEALWAFAAMRDSPFAPVVTGGEAARIRSVVTRAELLVLAQLAEAAGREVGR